MSTTTADIHSLKKNSRLNWHHWVIVRLSLVRMLGVWHVTKSQQDEKIQRHFEREAAIRSQSHGSQIWVRSVSGEGSTFYFSVPKMASKQQALQI
ncbi:MAG: hypothetical protein AB7L92_02110 [Alphaproteobacteria bacterium]